jgi:hypothetical protein
MAAVVLFLLARGVITSGKRERRGCRERERKDAWQVINHMLICGLYLLCLVSARRKKEGDLLLLLLGA